MEVDLNIDNYSFEDILNLFNLKPNFDLKDLKNALKMVSKIHPDKSNLEEKYFIFFFNVYKIL